MQFSIASIVSFLAATAVATAIPTKDVANGTTQGEVETLVVPNPDVADTITFCTRSLACNYPAIPITTGTCFNFNHVLQNDVTVIYIPSGYVCGLFINPGCSGPTLDIFAPINLVNTGFYADTNSYRCDFL